MFADIKIFPIHKNSTYGLIEFTVLLFSVRNSTHSLEISNVNSNRLRVVKNTVDVFLNEANCVEYVENKFDV